jgi:hypothetical protein
LKRLRVRVVSRKYVRSSAGARIRMAYEVGRHIVGYEVQKVLAAVDWFTKRNEEHSVPIGVAGYGEGGLIALYSAALSNPVSRDLRP